MGPKRTLRGQLAAQAKTRYSAKPGHSSETLTDSQHGCVLQYEVTWALASIPMDLPALIRRLRGEVAGELRADLGTRELYAADASLYRRRPAAALRAARPDDLDAALQACRETGVPLTMRGAGTSLAGQTLGRGLVVDCSALKEIHIDPDRQRAVVGPGVVLDDLNAAADLHGLLFGPDVATASRATLGGMISNNSAGARSVTYGQTADAVDALDVVLGTGARAALSRGSAVPSELAGCVELAGAMPTRKLLRRVSGYALDAMAGTTPEWQRLLCGSEGTLAVITEATLRLEVAPQARGLALVDFGSMDEALHQVPELLQTDPSAIELLDRAMTGGSGPVGSAEGDRGTALLIEYSGEASRVAARLKAIPGATRVTDPGDQDRLWVARRAGIAWALKQASRPTNGRDPRPVPFIEDPAVPPEQLPAFARELQRALDEEGTEAIWYGHASVGCLHIRPLMDLARRDEVQRMRRIASTVAQLVVDHDGSLSGEHGDGRARSELLPVMYPPKTMDAFRTLKRRLDPGGILNPGVIVDGEPLDNGLRAAVPTGGSADAAVEFRAEGGIARAGRACNGNGQCRSRTGAMCPSYQALGDERHSTRGRAVLFRAAVEGQLPDGLANPDLHDALDLCLSCKACGAECPAEVDMAWMKIAALARRRHHTRIPLRDKAVARAHTLLALGSRAPALARLGARVASARGLPVPAPVRRWRPARVSGSGPRVALMADTFTRFLEPRIGDAALDVLAPHREVTVVNPGCCGRPLLSAGFVGEARAQASRSLDRLAPLVLRDVPIVVLEPSCWSMLHDDIPKLLPDDPRARWVADATLSFEQLAAEIGLRGETDEGDIVHPHCHCRSLGGRDAAMEIAPGATDPGAGCCGMAGSFGYEHPELSRQIGEQTLAPTARQAGTIVAAGTSCRQQIERLTGRRALHPAELLAASDRSAILTRR